MVLQATDPWQNSAPEGSNCIPVASQKSREQESIHPALQLLLQNVLEDLGITGWKSNGIAGVGTETLVINRQVPLLPGQRQNLPRATAKSLALNVHTLVHQSPLKLILKKLSVTSWSFTVKLSPLTNIRVCTRSQLIQITVRKHLQIFSQNERASRPSHYTLRYQSLPFALSLAQPRRNSVRIKPHELQVPELPDLCQCLSASQGIMLATFLSVLKNYLQLERKKPTNEILIFPTITSADNWGCISIRSTCEDTNELDKM